MLEEDLRAAKVLAIFLAAGLASVGGSILAVLYLVA